MSAAHEIERALLQLLQALVKAVRAPGRSEAEGKLVLPAALARVLAAGGHHCREAVVQAAQDYVETWSTEQLVDELTVPLMEGAREEGTREERAREGGPPVSNLRVRVRQLRRRRQQQLDDLHVEVREFPAGSPFDPTYHRPNTETVPASSADKDGTIARMHAPAFVWREDGREQVIPAEVTLFGPVPESERIVPRPAIRKKKRRTRRRGV